MWLFHFGYLRLARFSISVCKMCIIITSLNYIFYLGNRRADRWMSRSHERKVRLFPFSCFREMHVSPYGRSKWRSAYILTVWAQSFEFYNGLKGDVTNVIKLSNISWGLRMSRPFTKAWTQTWAVCAGSWMSWLCAGPTWRSSWRLWARSWHTSRRITRR